MTARASQLRSLHAQPAVLILPNAWDAGSARLFEHTGAAAIATTSAGMAWALGHADGYQLPSEEVVHTATLIRRAITVPLSIDLENGYSAAPDAVAELALRLVDAGVDGINLEDGTDAPAVLAAKIAAIKEALASRGLDLFVNARTDVFLRGLIEPPRRVAETITRGATYKAAGADGLFVPGIATPDEIHAVVGGIALPLNVMAVSGLPAAAELAALGVRRLSAGSGLAQLMIGEAARRARKFLDSGRSDLFDGAMAYSEIQAILRK